MVSVESSRLEPELSWELEHHWQRLHSEFCDCQPDDDGPCFYSRQRMLDELGVPR